MLCHVTSRIKLRISRHIIEQAARGRTICAVAFSGSFSKPEFVLRICVFKRLESLKMHGGACDVFSRRRPPVSTAFKKKVAMPCKLTSEPSAPKTEKLSQTVCPTRVAYIFCRMMASFRKGVQCVSHAVARSGPKSQDRTNPEKRSKNDYHQKGPPQCVRRPICTAPLFCLFPSPNQYSKKLAFLWHLHKKRTSVHGGVPHISSILPALTSWLVPGNSVPIAKNRANPQPGPAKLREKHEASCTMILATR